jgi:hypothetical protein
VYVGHDDASSAYLIDVPSTNRTRVVETPNFIEDACGRLRVSPDRLHLRTYLLSPWIPPSFSTTSKPAPFHDTVNPKDQLRRRRPRSLVQP